LIHLFFVLCLRFLKSFFISFCVFCFFYVSVLVIFFINALTPSKSPPLIFAGNLTAFVKNQEPKDYRFRDQIADDTGDVHYGTVEKGHKEEIIFAVSQGIHKIEHNQIVLKNPVMVGGDTAKLHKTVKKKGKKACLTKMLFANFTSGCHSALWPKPCTPSATSKNLRMFMLFSKRETSLAKMA